ncbi:MAG: hypothetical protein AMJ92_02005 [candidate division Zixibacteria bacterium SM23_81]|nr:MAG: hypothetical protein AMJ92_02005 [candidate division Zixibacteria bacterium SM23_81]
MKHFLLVALAFVLLPSFPKWSLAQSAASGLYQQANQAYGEGKFPEAIKTYEKILESGFTNGAVLYNLGNAYFKDNQLGRAILFYERAKRLLPRDQDVAANLALASQLTVDKIASEKTPRFMGVFTWPARSMSIAELTRVSFFLYIITAALVLVTIWTRSHVARKRLLLASFIAGVMLIIGVASLLGNIHGQQMVSWIIILNPVSDARSGPGDEYTKIFTIHEGTKARIRQQREGWYLISLPNGLAGWIPQEIAEII